MSPSSADKPQRPYEPPDPSEQPSGNESTNPHEVRKPILPDETPRGALRVALIALALCVAVAIAVTAVSWSSLHSFEYEDSLGTLLLLGLVTVVGGLIGLVTLILAIVNYGRRHGGMRAFVVVCVSLALLLLGGWLIVVLTQPLDPYYQAQQDWLARSDAIGQQWKVREHFPSCGTVTITTQQAVATTGTSEFRCMRRANAAATPAEMQIARPWGTTWWVRTDRRSVVEVYILQQVRQEENGEASPHWSHRTCYAQQVLLLDAQHICTALGWNLGE